MKKLFFLFIPLLFAMSVAPVKWVVQKNDVKINFYMPKNNKTGSLNGMEAEIEFNPLSPADSKITAKVDVSTLKTTNADLTNHLLESDFFDVVKFPTITFSSASVSKTDSNYIAKGELTMKGVSKNVEIPFRFIETDSTSVFKGTMTIYSGDYKLAGDKENDPSTQVDITIEVPVKKN